MSSTVVETLPVVFCKLKNDNGLQNNFSYVSGIKGCCASDSYHQPASAISSNFCASKGNILGDNQNKFLRLVVRIREPVADYLERHGLPKNARCSFVSLITSLIQRSYAAGVTILMMLYNLFPLLDGFVYLLRFILDKMLEICQTKDTTERALKGILFVGELIVLMLLVMFIFGLIVMPVLSLMSYIVSKFVGVATSVS